MTDTLGDASPSGYQAAVEVGPGLAVLFFPDGAAAFRHRCDRGDRGVIVCAPFLRLGPHAPGHRITSRTPLTVEPSILCPDCGTHGFVRRGAWTGV